MEQIINSILELISQSTTIAETAVVFREQCLLLSQKMNLLSGPIERFSLKQSFRFIYSPFLKMKQINKFNNKSVSIFCFESPFILLSFQSTRRNNVAKSEILCYKLCGANNKGF